MINYAQKQKDEVRKEQRKFIEEANFGVFQLHSKQSQYPVGSVFKWALQAVYGPEGSAR